MMAFGMLAGAAMPAPALEDAIIAEAPATMIDVIAAVPAAIETEAPDVTALLQAHVDSAAAAANATGLSPAQAAAAASNPGLAPAFYDSNVDAMAKASIAADPALSSVQITPRFQFGPDFYSSSTGQWWDITTDSQWANHVDKYTQQFGNGIHLTY